MSKRRFIIAGILGFAGLLVLFGPGIPPAQAQPYCDDTTAVLGGSLSPCDIPKYVTPLVIPPEMPKSTGDPTVDYNIAVRQFQQQILPAGFPSTTVWSYGRAEDPDPVVAPNPAVSSFNYPAFTIEATENQMTKVRWINDLVDAGGNYLPHLLTDTVDQTVHWANPPQECAMGPARTDCKGIDPNPYTGPVPIVTHVHGAHVGPESDGYPEAWWLPAANNIPAGYATTGTLFDQYDPTNAFPGSALFAYPNDQRTTTLWYHDHSLGMTRLNVYAGPAGFWLVRTAADGEVGITQGVLPGPAPKTGDSGGPYYEIPIVIQDRSFNTDGSLFYPDNRAFFEGLPVNKLKIDFAPDSDVLPIWNPEAFFNAMVVNGNTWPFLDVEPRRYRFRLLDGCNSRFLNLAMFVVNGDGSLGSEIPFYVIGTEGGLLPKVVRVLTGERIKLKGNGKEPAPAPDPLDPQALLMGPAERMDVIVDFTGLTEGTVVRMVNTAPDAPFGGFPDIPADAGTTGQVMQFVVGPTGAPDPSTPPRALKLANRSNLNSHLPPRVLSLNEEESAQVCVEMLPSGIIKQVDGVFPPDCGGLPGVVPFGPTAALLGTLDPISMITTPLLWSEDITENPALGSTETWAIWNFTADAHPIHLHLVQFQVVNRQVMGVPGPYAPEPWEEGWKDTVIAYPGEITRINTKFDIEGLYVWHCHIVEHEDNEMMRPYYVGNPCNSPVPVAGAVCP